VKKFIGVALLAFAINASAQTRVGTVTTGTGSSAVGAPAIAPGAVSLPQMGVVLPMGSVSLSAAPAPGLNTVQSINAVNAAGVKIAVPATVSPIAAVIAPSGMVLGNTATTATPDTKPPLPLSRSDKAAAVVRDEVANWQARSPEDGVLAPAFSHALSNLSPMSAASSPEARGASVPPPKSPASSARPQLSKKLVIAGVSLLGVALAASAMPALIPAAVISVKGILAWSGLAVLAASRFYREPGAAPDVPRGPPAPAGGSFSSFKAAWAAARDSAAAQKSFETNVGGSDKASFKTWLLGGLRTGLYWMAPSLLLMLAGAGLAKGGMFLLGVTAAAAAPAAVVLIPLSALLLTYLPMTLAAEAASVALFFGVTALARKLGAGRASAWLGGAAALGLAAAVITTLTASPFIVIVSLSLEAGVLWAASRSNSFLAPLTLRAILTIFSLEAARLGAWIKLGGAGVLVGLPPVWGGLAVLGLVLLAIKLKAPGLRLKEIGDWWNAPDAAQKPKSPGRVLSAGILWGLVIYAIGDLTHWAIHAIAPGTEPAPGILAKMLTGGVDLVLYNFVIVGLLEEYVFRRGLFKMMNDKLDKWGLSLQKAFWIAAIGSGIIFSGVHYIDWGAMLARIGMGDPAASSGLAAGAYAFSWAGFVARSVLGVVLAWMYKRSGLLMIPIVAHFWANSMEGLGLRWGLPAFLALAAGALLLSFLFKGRPQAAGTNAA